MLPLSRLLHLGSAPAIGSYAGAFRRSAAVAALFLGGVSPAAGQVSIQAVDSEGHPIPAVQVEWYAPGALLGSTLTGPDGVAEIPEDGWESVVRIHLRFLGLETRVVQRRNLPDDGVIRMEPTAVAVEGITVEVGHLCPSVDDPRARREWARVARRYSPETGARARSANFRLSKERVAPEELYAEGDANPERVHLAQSGGGVIHGDDPVFRPLDERTRSDGYAWPPFFNVVSVRQLKWSYPELDRGDAHHFASAAFGELHTFQMLEEGSERTILAFCGRDASNRTTLHGTLTLVPERAFVQAEWAFVSPTDDEGAGGAVVFDEVVEAYSGARHLVAAEGTFYRRSSDGTGRYVVERSTEARWLVFPTADHPCSNGRSLYGSPPRSQKAAAFARCMADHDPANTLWPGAGEGVGR